MTFQNDNTRWHDQMDTTDDNTRLQLQMTFPNDNNRWQYQITMLNGNSRWPHQKTIPDSLLSSGLSSSVVNWCCPTISEFTILQCSFSMLLKNATPTATDASLLLLLSRLFNPRLSCYLAFYRGFYLDCYPDCHVCWQLVLSYDVVIKLCYLVYHMCCNLGFQQKLSSDVVI
jgi:hypothetical protein